MLPSVHQWRSRSFLFLRKTPPHRQSPGGQAPACPLSCVTLVQTASLSRPQSTHHASSDSGQDQISPGPARCSVTRRTPYNHRPCSLEVPAGRSRQREQHRQSLASETAARGHGGAAGRRGSWAGRPPQGASGLKGTACPDPGTRDRPGRGNAGAGRGVGGGPIQDRVASGMLGFSEGAPKTTLRSPIWEKAPTTAG